MTARSHKRGWALPKDTFFNLPEKKRELICTVALDEFAQHSFEQASINRIVDKAGIAKGSFYQYFEDKKDLFLYLMQLAGEAKLAYISPLMRNPDEHDFVTLLGELYRTGIQYAIEHPQYFEIGKRLLENKDSPILDQVLDSNMESAYGFFETLLASAIERGEVRADIDLKMYAYMIASMNTLVVEYYVENVEPEEHGDMMPTIEMFLDFLRYGIGHASSLDPVA
jgi:AcrR family transcriptional regulator